MGDAEAASASHTTKSLFAVQLEVTAKLLEAEHRKLDALRAEITTGLHRDGSAGVLAGDSLEKQQANYQRLQMQYDRLNKEYQEAAVNVFRRATQPQKSQRSVPALGMKQTAKARPSIFDSIFNADQPSGKRSRRKPSIGDGSIMCISPTGSTSSVEEGGVSENGGVDSASAASAAATHMLYYEDGNLIAGTLDALVRHLTPSSNHYPDRVFIFAFLLCSRLFIRPYDLLQRVSRAFQLQHRTFVAAAAAAAAEENDVASSSSSPSPNFVQLVSEWTEMFAYDFRDERMMRNLKEITQLCASSSADLRHSVGQVMQGLIKKLSTLDKYEAMLARAEAASMEKQADGVHIDIVDVCDDADVLARQLVHIEMERLTNIGAEEFIQAFVDEGNKATTATAFRDMKKTTNLEAYVEWFNRLSYLVATEICVGGQTPKHRVRVIEFFIDVARTCFRLGNFNSFMAIVSGLNMTPVSRLKRTWSKLPAGTDFNELEQQMDPTSNFASYRGALTNAVESSSTEPTNAKKCVIPFFSLLIKDIYVLNQVRASKLPDGRINFKKFWEMSQLITQFMSWKRLVPDYARDKVVLNYLMTAPVAAEDALYLSSYEAESPETQFEKDNLKALKLKMSAKSRGSGHFGAS
ncbi:ras-GEF domain-containing family member 1B-like [Oscarella lobularis]|uniref:ras-GEF domain-containing family member 1B-like n=1 Tax=Oscarella lobularis TaxID=121494 RepID=UPI003313C3FD